LSTLANNVSVGLPSASPVVIDHHIGDRHTFNY